MAKKKSTKKSAPKKTAKKATQNVAPKAVKRVAKKAAAKTATKAAAKVAKKTAPKAKAPKAKALEVSNTETAAPAVDLAAAAYFNYIERLQNGLPGDALSDWVAAEEASQAA